MKLYVKRRETDTAVHAEIASIFNVCSVAGTSTTAQEAMEINEDSDDGINYSPNPDTPERVIEETVTQEPVTTPVSKPA